VIDWHHVEDKLPEENEKCILYKKGFSVIGPIIWKGTMWIDLFGPLSDEEAGACFSPGGESGPTHWAHFDDI
jgi:hypothetical protein